MTHRPVRSSNLASVAYENGTLEVRFKSGARYRWAGVTSIEHGLLLKARSKGAFLRNHITYWHGPGEKMKG